MRRLMAGLVPAFVLITSAGALQAQTRTAPSIGDVTRGSQARVQTQTGVRTRGVNLPMEQACGNARGEYAYDGRFDRGNGTLNRGSDRDRHDRDRDDDRDRKGNRYGQGCCAYDNAANGRAVPSRGGSGTGTMDTRRSGTATGVYANASRNGVGRGNGCGYDQRHDNRRDDDHGRDWREHDFDRSHRH